jgi:RNA polymerase primary sigma factor
MATHPVILELPVSQPRTASRRERADRARPLPGKATEYIHSSEFDAPDADAVILGPVPGGLALPGAADRFRDVGETPLLDRDQELYLFRRMNYRLHLASRLCLRADPARGRAGVLDEIERLRAEALAIKNYLILANARLVMAVAKTRIGSSVSFSDLVSEGNMTLIRAVERFDYALGNRFSTYATWALRRTFDRLIPLELGRRAAFTTGHETVFTTVADTRSDKYEQEQAEQRARDTVARLLDGLDERERQVVVRRYGLGGGESMTLAAIGREMGVSKERARQLTARAEDKLRRLAGVEDAATLRRGA